MKSKIHYLNTDLYLVSSLDLTLLANALAQQGLLVLHLKKQEEGLWSASFETAERFSEPDENIAAMLTVLEGLNESSRSLWVSCTTRDFNIGYDCGDEPWAFNQQISTARIAGIAAANAAIVITLYPAEGPSDHGSPVVSIK